MIEGESVGAVITAACERFGPEFVDVLDHSRIWLNGDECQPSDRVSPTDEIAVLPPVSGG